MALLLPDVSLLSLERYAAVLSPARMSEVRARVTSLSARLAGRVVWNISSTAVGGGVAEMVRSLLAYARGAGVDARWVVISGTPEFFRLTKRLHNAVHGSEGDGSPLGPAERAIYERIAEANLAELAPMVRPHDVVIVHDPQPASMVPGLAARGAHVIWRCHIGHDQWSDEVRAAWEFLAPYLRDASAYVFSRAAYVPSLLDAARAVVIAPSLDPFSPKNQRLDEPSVRAILLRCSIIAGAADGAAPLFVREDGTPGRVDRAAEVVHEGALPSWETPLVVQVSRWDRLKDPFGVLRGFLRVPHHGARLVLAGADVRAVADDPEGAAVYRELLETWRALPAHERARVLLMSVPTADVDENAAIVNALQRHAAIVVQKSLREGFGLTVAEAMWKERPVVASAVGGIVDQIDDGVDGLLVHDPSDPDEFARAIGGLLDDRERAAHLGAAAHARVLRDRLGLDSLLRYGALIERLDRQ